MEENPYSSPESEVIDETSMNDADAVLADRSTRLVAAILDGLILMVLFLPIVYITGLMDFRNPRTDLASSVIISLVGVGVYLLINGKLLLSRGQTLGKKIMNIKVIDESTKQVPSAGDIIGKRYLIFYIIGQIPFLSIVNIIDALMIFRSSKKCLHDDFANTIVVKA